MFHVLICDDEIPTCNYIEQVLLNYAKEKKIDIVMDLFFSGETLLQYMEQNKNIDLIFLDIQLPGSNGAQIGKKLRNELENETVQIVYISSKDSYAMQLFQVRPFDFLIKPLDDNLIIHTFEKYQRVYREKLQFFEYKIGKQKQKILLSEIMYFRCEQKKVCIVTRTDKIYFYASMKELHQMIGSENFWSVHNSFIINENFVRQFREKEIIMFDNYCIPVSKAYKKEFKKKLAQLSKEE